MPLALAAATLMLTCFFPACSSRGESTEESEPSVSSAPSSETAPFPHPEVGEDLSTALLENSDVVGWLYVPGTTINEPVVQGTDNSYYLRRNYKKGYAYSGSLFLDYRANRETLSQNNVVYGHNLGSPMGRKDDPEGDKFAQLLKFTELDFAKQNPYFYYTTKEKRYVFQIFCVAYAEAYTRPVEYHHEKYTASEFTQLTKDLMARSLYQYGAAIKPDDKLLTLSTCTYRFGTYSQNPDQRFIVVGRLLPEGASYAESVDIKPNESIKEPDFSKR